MIDVNVLQQAVSLTQQGKIREAENIYLELLESSPEDSALLSLIGLFYVNIKNYTKAVEFLTKACSIKETLGTVSALGFAAFELNDYHKAANFLEKSLNYGQNPDVYNKLILSLFEIKDFERAIEYTDKMFELYPEDVRSATNKIKALTKVGKLLEAESFCIESLKRNPESASLWLHFGFLYELIYSDDLKAIECYKAALELGNLQANYNIAVSYQKLDNFEQAEYYYKQMLEVYPNDDDTIT